MPKRSREDKLASYSNGAKRGYRARKRFCAVNGVGKMKEDRLGVVDPLNCQPGVADRGRALGNAGPMDAIQLSQELRNHETYTNAARMQAVINS
jgi:hypothetical protein